ncbi:CPXCG motif-containing cysteine-rich protein [Natronospira bacteriovora]|uniref:CPXCG motif-containing cysteine-rich protein n=1 Tax=Natronospira bacteriovora TaxID=3069753 RepID=A0ABU0W8W7_9GAMM|nr:CPXCG motif-containing cysteine-rich protein [Natronospira sp. AB-CW4]MDQ2070198.1 CPXCG motif-containing cysteine-rich protein [Natronospira sp. AB-CW4]
MEGLNVHEVTCPWCFEAVELYVEDDAEAGEWVEDCPVCCHPMALIASVDEQGGHRLSVERSH